MKIGHALRESSWGLLLPGPFVCVAPGLLSSPLVAAARTKPKKLSFLPPVLELLSLSSSSFPGKRSKVHSIRSSRTNYQATTCRLTRDEENEYKWPAFNSPANWGRTREDNFPVKSSRWPRKDKGEHEKRRNLDDSIFELLSLFFVLFVGRLFLLSVGGRKTVKREKETRRLRKRRLETWEETQRANSLSESGVCKADLEHFKPL